jgi:hypothetical protein
VRRRRPNRVALWLCFALQVVLGVPASLGLSLCVDSDGGHSLEIAHEQVACLRLGHTGGAGVAVGLPGQEQPCRDLPLLERRDYEARVARGVPPPAMLATLPPPIAAPDRLVTAAVRRNAVQARLDSLLRRSVVLIV